MKMKTQEERIRIAEKKIAEKNAKSIAKAEKRKAKKAKSDGNKRSDMRFETDKPRNDKPKNGKRYITVFSSALIILIACAVIFYSGWFLAPTLDGTQEKNVDYVTINDMNQQVVCPSLSTPSAADDGDSSFSSSNLYTKTYASAFGSINTSSLLDSDAVTGKDLKKSGGIYVANSTSKKTQIISTSYSADNNVAGSVGSTYSKYNNGDLKGAATGVSVLPSTEAWFAGGSTQVGNYMQLKLVNLYPNATQVQISVWGDKSNGSAGTSQGAGMALQGSNTVRVDGEQTETVNLESLASDQDNIVVHVKSSGTPIAAYIQYNSMDGYTSKGMDFVPQTAEPQKQVVINSIKADKSLKNSLVVAAFEDTNLEYTVMQSNSVGSKNNITVNASNSQSYTVSLKGGKANVIDLSNLKNGSYSIILKANNDIVAGAKTTLTSGSNTDFCFHNAESGTTNSVFAIPMGLSGTIDVTNAYGEKAKNTYSVNEVQDAKIVVTSYDVNGKVLTSKTITLSPNATAEINLDQLKKKKTGAAYVYITTENSNTPITCDSTFSDTKNGYITSVQSSSIDTKTNAITIDEAQRIGVKPEE